MDSKKAKGIQRNNSANHKTYIRRSFNSALSWNKLFLKNTENQPEYSIEFFDGEFEVIKNIPRKIKKIYENWLVDRAKSVFVHKVDEYSKKLGVKVESITIMHLKNRWGSMTKEGSINLNVNLLKAPQDVIDYIILHEPSHLKIEEHSYHYWDYVRRYMPNYQEKIEWLKLSGSHLV